MLEERELYLKFFKPELSARSKFVSSSYLEAKEKWDIEDLDFRKVRDILKEITDREEFNWLEKLVKYDRPDLMEDVGELFRRKAEIFYNQLFFIITYVGTIDDSSKAILRSLNEDNVYRSLDLFLKELKPKHEGDMDFSSEEVLVLKKSILDYYFKFRKEAILELNSRFVSGLVLSTILNPRYISSLGHLD